MKKIILLGTAFLLTATFGYSQQDTSITTETPVVEEAPVAAPEDNNIPVREPWGSGYIFDNQTSYIPTTNTLEVVIQHRFGSMENGIKDVFGIYASANLRMAFNYTIFKNFQIGYGLTRKNMYSDFNLKYTVFEQTRSNSKPVALTFYANAAIDGRDKKILDPGFSTTNRMSFFSQLIIGRKVNDHLSIQAAASFSHFNRVSADMQHDIVGVHFNGRWRISPQTSFMFNYDLPLKIQGISEQKEFVDGKFPKPNLAFGAEISTSTHAFHILMGTANGILPQDNMVFNQNDYKTNGLQIGFVITRLWNF